MGYLENLHVRICNETIRRFLLRMTEQNSTREEIVIRDGGLCIVCAMLGSDVHEINHRSTCPKDKQVESGIFNKTNRVLLCRKHHIDIGSPYVGKVLLRYLLHLKYGYQRPAEIPENWFMDTIVRYLMYVNAGWKRPDLKENLK
jgi:hypothetical protein